MVMQFGNGDLRSLIGRFIVQVDVNDKSHNDISQSKNSEFWLEKRISFVVSVSDGGYVLGGFYYNHGVFKTFEDLVKHLNKTGENRAFRLLRAKELIWLNARMIERNY